jgi:SAM-dependent methyltransferase
VIFEYKGNIYPEYIKYGNACQFIAPFALQFCKGIGLDVGASKWPLPGAIPVDLSNGTDGMNLLDYGTVDFIFSSHCLEHLVNPVAAIEHWFSRIRSDGVLFLYLPSDEMEYWLPQNNRKHLHTWKPEQMGKMLIDLGFEKVIWSQRDLAWSFAVVGFKP